MKALKTVAVALGVTLAALIVIPLAVLAGLFVWLKLTEEADEEILELDQETSAWPRPRTVANPRRPPNRRASNCPPAPADRWRHRGRCPPPQIADLPSSRF